MSAKNTSIIKNNLPTENITQKIRFVEQTTWSRQINRDMEDGSMIKFIANQSGDWHTIKLKVDNSLPNRYWFDAETGKSLAAIGDTLSYKLGPYGSIFFVGSKESISTNEFVPMTDLGTEIIKLETWDIQIGDKTYKESTLFEWRDKEETKYISGKGQYSTTFHLRKKKRIEITT